LPGLLHRFSLLHGTFGSGRKDKIVDYEAIYLVPQHHVTSIINFFNLLVDLGFFSRCDIFLTRKIESSFNFNTYQRDATGEWNFSWNNDSGDDQDLISSTLYDFEKSFHEGKIFMKNLSVRKFHVFRKFVDLLLSPQRMIPTRYGSHVQILSRLSGARKETINEWLKKYIIEKKALMPLNRNFIHAQFLVPVFTSVIVFSKKTMTKRQKNIFKKPFVSTSYSEVSALSGQKNQFIWHLNFPPDFINKAFDHVKKLDSNAYCMVILLKNLSLKPSTSIPWFSIENKSFFDLSPMFSDYERSLKKIANDQISIKEHLKDCAKKWLTSFQRYMYGIEPL
ncbi:MAG: hypothetical protein ACTSXU_11080, partial [Promethearchaeota archaeon]